MAHAKQRLSEIEKELRRQTAAKFHEVVDAKFKGNRSEAARALGLTRQRFQLYLEGRFTAGAEILGLACELWGIEIIVGNIRLTSQQLRKRKVLVDSKEPLQLDLFNKPQALSSRNVAAVVKRKNSETLSLVLEISLADHVH
jgi:hypothetical protein